MIHLDHVQFFLRVFELLLTFTQGFDGIQGFSCGLVAFNRGFLKPVVGFIYISGDSFSVKIEDSQIVLRS